jgi:hypothetical protein
MHICMYFMSYDIFWPCYVAVIEHSINENYVCTYACTSCHRKFLAMLCHGDRAKSKALLPWKLMSHLHSRTRKISYIIIVFVSFQEINNIIRFFYCLFSENVVHFCRQAGTYLAQKNQKNQNKLEEKRKHGQY